MLEIENTTKGFSKDTFMYICYVLYKANLLTRHNLREIFNVIKKETPTNITEYLVGEVGKL